MKSGAASRLDSDSDISGRKTRHSIVGLLISFGGQPTTAIIKLTKGRLNNNEI